MGNDFQSPEQLDTAWGGTPPAPPPGESSGDLIPDKTRVWAIVHDQRFKQTPNTGTMYINIPFEIVGPPQYAGKWIWHKFFITGNTLQYLKRDFEILGWLIPKLSAILTPEDNSLVGFGAEFMVGNESYDKNDVDPNTGAPITTKVTKNIVKMFTGAFNPTTKPWENPPPAATTGAKPPAAAQAPAARPAAAQAPVARPAAAPAAQPPPAAPAPAPAAAPLAGGKPAWGFHKQTPPAQ